MKKYKSFLFVVMAFLAFSCNHKPDIPACVSPTAGASDITDSSVTLTWKCSDPDGDNLVFDVYFSRDETGMISESDRVARSITESNYTVDNLKDNTKYYWQIIAQDPKGKFSLNVWSFSTGKIKK